ncbi:hypothetical protein RUND412_007638 [Rhizina undulata]
MDNYSSPIVRTTILSSKGPFKICYRDSRATGWSCYYYNDLRRGIGVDGGAGVSFQGPGSRAAQAPFYSLSYFYCYPRFPVLRIFCTVDRDAAQQRSCWCDDGDSQAAYFGHMDACLNSCDPAVSNIALQRNQLLRYRRLICYPQAQDPEFREYYSTRYTRVSFFPEVSDSWPPPTALPAGVAETTADSASSPTITSTQSDSLPPPSFITSTVFLTTTTFVTSAKSTASSATSSTTGFPVVNSTIAPDASTASASTSSGSHLSKGKIAGIVVASTAGFAFIVAVLILLARARRKRRTRISIPQSSFWGGAALSRRSIFSQKRTTLAETLKRVRSSILRGGAGPDRDSVDVTEIPAPPAYFLPSTPPLTGRASRLGGGGPIRQVTPSPATTIHSGSINHSRNSSQDSTVPLTCSDIHSDSAHDSINPVPQSGGAVDEFYCSSSTTCSSWSRYAHSSENGRSTLGQHQRTLDREYSQIMDLLGGYQDGSGSLPRTDSGGSGAASSGIRSTRTLC